MIQTTWQATCLVKGSGSGQGNTGGGGGNEGILYGAIGSFAAAGLGAVIMGTLGGMALGEYENLRTGCGSSQSCTEAQVSDANTFALISDIGMGLAIAGAAAGTALLVVALSSGGGGQADRADGSLILTPWGSAANGSSAGGLVLSGDF